MDEIKVSLRCQNNEIHVICDISFSEPVVSFTFSINKLLKINEISSDAACTYKKPRAWKPTFLASCQQIDIKLEKPSSKLRLTYGGRVKGWVNIVEQNRIALSTYSAWYPIITSIPLHYIFVMENMENYFILNARYNQADKTWVYGESDYDPGNVIAFKKDFYYKDNIDSFSFYYINKNERKISEWLLHDYQDIIRYYRDAFGEKHMNKFDIVSLGTSGRGAYFRKELVVVSRFKGYLSSDKATRLRVTSLLAHELGHSWFSGAAPATWEDWLNETGANWASPLYALDRGRNDLFDDIIRSARRGYTFSPVIKTKDGGRPPKGVHKRGTMLLFEIYKVYGKEAIISFLSILSGLEEKTTENLLEALRRTGGDEVADLIAKGMTMKKYKTLCGHYAVGTRFF